MLKRDLMRREGMHGYRGNRATCIELAAPCRKRRAAALGDEYEYLTLGAGPIWPSPVSYR